MSASVWMELVFYGLCLGFALYEVLSVSQAVPARSISEIAWALSARPLFPFVMGMIAGHFFWQRNGH